MKNLIQTTLITLALSLSTLHAGSGHDHSHDGHHHAQVSEKDAQNIATKKLSKLIKDGKVSKSWLDTSVFETKKKRFGHKMEWVVSYKNAKIENQAKQTLYIFVSLSGKITGTNYSGK